jgi:putative hydrolase of the HAD superfamily
MLSDVDAVVFDLDGTLLDRRRSFEQFSRDQWQRFAQSLAAVDPDLYLQVLVELDSDGYAPRDRLFAGAVARFGLAIELADELLRDYRGGFPGACVLFPDAVGTLMSLRASGLKLGLVTNGSAGMQSRKIECLRLSAMFDAVLISAVEGVHKPDARLFRRALDRLEVEPSHSVFVGDHPDVDVAGARGAGMRTIWRRNTAALGPVEADAVIEELGDLLPLLGIPAADGSCLPAGSAGL